MTEGCGLIDSFVIYWTIKLWCGVTNFVVIIELGCFELTNKELITILNRLIWGGGGGRWVASNPPLFGPSYTILWEMVCPLLASHPPCLSIV